MPVTQTTVDLSSLILENCEFDDVTIDSGAGTIARGRVLALSTGDAGKYIVADTSATTNNQHLAVCVAWSESVDASSSDQPCRVITSGKVRAGALVLPSSQNINSRNGSNKSIKESLQDNGITVIETVGESYGN